MANKKRQTEEETLSLIKKVVHPSKFSYWEGLYWSIIRTLSDKVGFLSPSLFSPIKEGIEEGIAKFLKRRKEG